MFRVIYRGEKALCLSLPDRISTTIHTISISLQSVGFFFQHSFYTSGPEKIHTVATHPAALTTILAVILEF